MLNMMRNMLSAFIGKTGSCPFFLACASSADGAWTVLAPFKASKLLPGRH